MMKDVKREFLRQIQETMQFKFNLFFANFSIFIMVSSYLHYFEESQNKFTLFCLLFTWYFTSHSITHPTFFIEDDIYDRTLISVIQSKKSVVHVLLFKILVQILIDLIKAIPIFLILSFLSNITFPASIVEIFVIVLICLLVILILYGLGFCLSSFCLTLNRTSSFTSLLSYFILFFTGILKPFDGFLGILGHIFPFYTLREFIHRPSITEVLIILWYGVVYWSIGFVLFHIFLKMAKKKGNIFHV